MTRLFFLAYLAWVAPACVLDCLRKGFTLKQGVRWTWASTRATWRMARAR
jgi:hypothetical protein